VAAAQRFETEKRIELVLPYGELEAPYSEMAHRTEDGNESFGDFK
jgi:hypothetical protein